MFVVTLSFSYAMILIKRVLSAMVFMPKIRSGWSAIYVINGFMRNVSSFTFFLKYCFKTMMILMKFSIASWRKDKFLNNHLK